MQLNPLGFVELGIGSIAVLQLDKVFQPCAGVEIQSEVEFGLMTENRTLSAFNF